MRAGFFPCALYGATRLVDALNDLVQNKNDKSNQIIDLLTDLYADKPITRQADMRRTVRDAIFRAASCMHALNPTHLCGLIMNYVTEAPLKRDLCYRGTCEMSYLLTHVKGFTDIEKSMMAIDLRKKGFAASINGLPKALYSWGRI
jgi:hypothetical protein